MLSFVNQSGSKRSHIRLHGLVFTAGVVLSFWVLTGVLIALRASGEQLGWGFQLQHPSFVYSLAILTFLLGLNLGGAFEINARFLSVGSHASHHAGLWGSFFSGMLSTVLATPCSAPFLATSLGAALVLPTLQAFTLFTFIGLGLSAPYLFLSIFPNLISWLPKPGPWMQAFRQVMGFFMYATTAFLLWVLVAQVSEPAFIYVLVSLFIARIGVWAYGYSQGAQVVSATIKRMFAGVGILLVILALFVGFPEQKEAPLEWEDWSALRVKELREEGRLIFIDFTARWCATCQTNKRSYEDEKVIERFRELNVALLKADWTNKDPRITAALAEFQRSAVPLNVLYAPTLDEPIIFPSILLPHIILEALDGLKKEMLTGLVEEQDLEADAMPYVPQ